MEERMSTSRGEIALFIGELIRSLRIEKGLSQTDVAVKLGTQKSWVSEIERGDKLASLVTIKSLCEAMDEDPLNFMLRCLTKIDWNDCHKKQLESLLSMN
jgi:transcriptional regulator with XRE-family HTH domain